MSEGTAERQSNDGNQGRLAASHPRLYHYTGAHAFRSIVMRNSLWSTYYENLNDATEFRHTREPLAKVMADRFQPMIETLADANPRCQGSNPQ
jgi:hypothetical protein